MVSRDLETLDKPNLDWWPEMYLFDENNVHSAMAETDRDQGLNPIRRQGAHWDRYIACPLHGHSCCSRRSTLDSVVKRGLPSLLDGFVQLFRVRESRECSRTA